MKRMERRESVKDLRLEVERSSLGGLGMFAESYFIFAIGELNPIWALLYSSCYNSKNNAICNNSCSQSVTYVEMAAIIVGMLIFEFVATACGRKIGSVATAVLMFSGSVILTASGGTEFSTMALINLSVFILGAGVGGEYPLSSVAAAERYEEQRLASHSASHNRGRTVVLTFSMQGWGNLINIAVLLIILSATPSADCTPVPGHSTEFVNGTTCNNQDLNLTWRLTCGIGAVGLLGVLLYRIFFMKESTVWLKEQQKEHDMNAQKKTEHKHRLNGVVAKYYWSRLFGTAFCWCMLNVSLYGNRLFQAAIVSQLVGGAPTLKTTYEYTLLNAAFALAGYYFSAFVVDNPHIGRMRLQTVGFALMTVFFFASAGVADKANAATLQALYYLSSFFSQLPNCTTFLVPAEIFPTEIRTFAHGVSAASGKVGALAVTLLYAFGFKSPNNFEIFTVSAVASVIGLLVTVLFIPDEGAVELSDLDEKFDAELDGNPNKYTGAAISKSALSYYEIMVGVHRRLADQEIQPAAGN